uniref:Paraneoplastic antigen Ma-like C-terminal domain-containing protein n=1 Tax=Oreochromis niloticus TaxID=8128 RepID=A0A669E392_ORENI
MINQSRVKLQNQSKLTNASAILSQSTRHNQIYKLPFHRHIVRSEALVSSVNASFRLRNFSGKLPCPSHEVDFDTLRHSVELLLQDPNLSDLQRSRKILDSLVPPAANVVKPLGPEALPSAYLELLHSAFGTVEDGDELFAKFLNTLQDAGEKPSHYLHRLQTALSKALKRGGVVAGEADRHLLRQFCRGCWDNALLTDLQLERKKDKPPSFTELLLQLRVEEDKHTAKEIASHSIAANADFPALTMQNDLTEMRTQITTLQSELTRLKPQKSNPPKANAKTNSKVPEQTPLTSQAAKSRPKPGYCFQCGEDGHQPVKYPKSNELIQTDQLEPCELNLNLLFSSPC